MEPIWTVIISASVGSLTSLVSLPLSAWFTERRERRQTFYKTESERLLLLEERAGVAYERIYYTSNGKDLSAELGELLNQLKDDAGRFRRYPELSVAIADLCQKVMWLAGEKLRCNEAMLYLTYPRIERYGRRSAGEVYELSRMWLGDQKGLVAVLRVYMDESGTHDGSPVVTVGCYVATPKQWRLWAKDWAIAKAPIKVFHATDCAALEGEFKGWSEPERDKYVAQLLPVITRFRLSGIVLGINLNDYYAALKGRDDLRELLGLPYEACFQWAVTEILESYPANERIAFIHENNDYQNAANAAFKYVQRYMDAADRTFLGFDPKSRYMPLQAADIIAFEGNKRLRGPLDRRPRRAWMAIDPLFGERRARIRYLNRENLPEVIETLSKIKSHNDRIAALSEASRR